jgi:hypothetical protein
MEEHKPVIGNEEVLQRISELGREATWTNDELRETLREGGIDPSRLVKRVMADVQRLLEEADAQPGNAGYNRMDTPRPLLVTLRAHSQLPPSAIAKAMDVPVAFLSVVSRHPGAVPQRWRQELAVRAKQALQVDEDIVMTSFDVPFQYDMAASRDEPYATDAVRDYSALLDRSGLRPEARHFWLTLATDETG